MRSGRALLLRFTRGHSRIEQLRKVLRSSAHVAQLRVAPLLCDTLQMRVIVERARLDLVQAFDVARPQIHAVDSPYRETGHEPGVTGYEHARRSREEIDAEAESVAKVRWAEERQDEIRSAVRAPGVERLAEITGLLRQATLRRRIEQPANAKRGVEEETVEGDAGSIASPLQQVIGENSRLGEVVEEGSNAVAQNLRDYLAVAFGNRLDDRLVQRGVDIEDSPVQRLERVIGRDALGGRSRTAGECGAKGC